MSRRRRTARVTKVFALLLALTGLAALGVVAANLAVLDGGTGGRVTGSVDCALVLGAGVRDDGSPSDVLRDRLDEALDLYRTGRVTRIIVSGDHQSARYDEPNAMRLYLEANGVPAPVIFMDHAGLDTYSSMWRARHVFGASRIVVVTQRFQRHGVAPDARSSVAYQGLRRRHGRLRIFATWRLGAHRFDGADARRADRR